MKNKKESLVFSLIIYSSNYKKTSKQELRKLAGLFVKLRKKMNKQ